MQPKQRSRNSEYAMDWTIRCSILFSKNVQTGSGVHTASYPMGTRALSSGAERAKRKADQSLPLSAEVKNEKRHSATPPVCLEGVHTNIFRTIETHERGCR